MTTQIKEYKELTIVQTFDDNLFTPLSLEDLQRLLTDDSKFIRIGNELINKNQIKRIYVSQIDSIENFILSQTKDIQDKLRAREKQKQQRL